MFYAEFLFSKKSALYAIWVAAHFDKKLPKSQINEINLINVIREIAESDVKLAIRLLGHLLYGIVKIFYHKTICACEDSSNVLTKLERIKIETHKPERKYKKIQRFRRGKDSNISKIEEITLKDESLPIMRIMQESLEESKIQPFEDEVMRSFMGGLEEKAFELSKLSNKTQAQDNTINDLNLSLPMPNIEISNFPNDSVNLISTKLESPINMKRKIKNLRDEPTFYDKKVFKTIIDDVDSLIRDYEKKKKINLVAPNKLFSDKILNILNDFSAINEISAHALEFEAPVFDPAFDTALSFGTNIPNFNETIKKYEIPDELNDTFKELSELIGAKDSSSFCEFTISDSRDGICKKFVALLQLYKLDAVNLTQNRPFDEIYISGNSHYTSSIAIT